MPRIAVPLALALVLAAPLPGARADDGAIGTERGPIRLVTVARGLERPWGMAFLPDGRLLVTEKPGRLRVVGADGKVGPPLAGVPAVDAAGQGGLLDVALDPEFAANRIVYLSYAEPRDGGNGTAVARGRLTESGLADVRVIFRQQPTVRSGHHFGSRLVFARDGRLFVTLGERNSERARAQTLDSHIGKVVRIERDGKVPADNPFAGRAGALPEIWSYGHRNVQGAALHPATGALWTHEHGPQGGDELNLTEAGKNHGWPVITHGRNYGTGTRIGEGTMRADVVAPLHLWLPTSIAPSGMAFVTSARYPEWQDSVLLGALRGQVLVRLRLEGARVVGEQRLLGTLNARIRDVRQSPDGWIYLLTDSADARIVRLERSDG